MDPQEKTNAFYVYSHNGSNLNETKGYFIYYESNEQMRDYAAENPVKIEVAQPPHEQPQTAAALSLAGESAAGAAGAAGAASAASAAGAAGAAHAHTVNRTVQRDVQDQKRVVNLLVALSAVMFIVSFIMGAGLIQNQDRISALENDIRQLSTSYRDIVSVFAQRSDPPAQKPSEAVSQPSAEQSASEQPAAAVIDVDGNEILQTQSSETAAVTSQEPPASETPTPETPVPSRYTIRDGDSLNSISRKFYGSTNMVSQIMRLNSIGDPDMIVSGRTIQLPPK
jgi:nucleoid-associated protein YgaU